MNRTRIVLPMSDLDSPRWSLWSSTVELMVDAESIFAELYATAETAIWLDSARSGYDLGRYSIMGAPGGAADDRLVYSATDRSVRHRSDGGDRGGDGSDGDRGGAGGVDGDVVARDVDVWTWLAERMAQEPQVDPVAELPFCGGYVGYLGYGTKPIGDSSRTDPAGRDAELVRLDRFLVVDHHTERLHVVATGPDGGEQAGRAWIAEVLVALEARAAAPPAATGEPLASAKVTSSSATAARASVDVAGYLADLGRVRDWLVAGDSYQACYTYALRFESREPPFETYRGLRVMNPAPYAAFLRFGDRTVLSSSPERYLRVDATGLASTRPIKGTARRSTDDEADAQIARDLQEDPKSRSENLMIVDLLRNDLGSVCVPGTVRVPRFIEVETYATVHQLVTEVEGVLPREPGAAARAAGALFPGGSMTGAPKRRSVELLDGLESAPRGVYSGVIGYFSRCGRADLSVVIRTAVIDSGDAGGGSTPDGDTPDGSIRGGSTSGADPDLASVTIGTGGAITLDSDPVAELEETIVKASAVLAAFGRVHPFPVDENGRLLAAETGLPGEDGRLDETGGLRDDALPLPRPPQSSG